MAVALIADAHLGGPGGAPEPLVEQLEALAARSCPHLVLLGDLFHVWVGDRRFETPEIAAVVPVLEKLRRSGTFLEYVEGNRDFFLALSPYADLFDRVAFETAFEAGGRRYLAVHGDGLNERDWQYRFWRWISKGSLSRILCRRMPVGLAQRFVRSTEEHLATANFKHKSRIPEEVIRRYAERRLAEGYDVLLLGHFHVPQSWRVNGGEVRLVEAWFRRREVQWLG